MSTTTGPEAAVGGRSRLLVGLCAGATAALAVAGIAGWLLDVPTLTTFGPVFFPIAPATALAFLALATPLGASVIVRPGRRLSALATAAAAVVAVLLAHSTVRAVQAYRSARPITAAGWAAARRGLMSPVTAVLLILACAALLLVIVPAARLRRAHEAAAAVAALVLAGGVIVSSGYWLGVPILYGGPVAPVALPTSLAFMTLALGLLSAVGSTAVAAEGRLPPLITLVLGVVVSFAIFGLVETAEKGSGLPHLPWQGRAVLSGGLLLTAMLAFYFRAQGRHHLEVVRANNALRAAEGRLRSVVQTANDAIVTTDERGTIVFWNATAERILGYTAEEAAGRNVVELVPERFREAHGRGLLRVADSGESRLSGRTVEMVALRRDGSELPVELSLARWKAGGQVFFTAMMRDITERRQAEALQAAVLHVSQAANEARDLGELLRSVHAVVERLMDARNFYVALHDPAAGVITFPYFVDEADATPAARTPGRGLTEYVIRTGRPLLATPTVFEALVAHGDVEPTGTPSIDWVGVPLLDGGEAIGAVVVQTYAEGTRYGKRELDILTFVSREVAAAVQRRRAQDALARSEEQYRAVVEDQTELICRYRTDGTLTFANEAFCRCFGRDREALVGSRFALPCPDHDRVAMQRLLASLGPGSPVGHLRMELNAADGEARIVAWSFRVIADAQGSPAEFQAVGRDVTEQTRLETRLQEAQRMESVAVLAGGVAHEFNNDLQAMLATTHVLAAGNADPRVAGTALRQLEDTIERSARHARQLLLFARRDVLRRERLDLNEVVEGAEGLVSTLVPAAVRFELQPGAQALPVDGDRNQLEQVLANLVVNAIDAMPDGGRLSIRTAGPDRGFASLEVQDTGAGIPEEARERLFEPFFTTKPGGSGLGLAVAHGIVTSHGGRIEVVSAAGEGTTFRVLLPSAGHGPAPAPRAGSGASRAGRILVVEDEDAAREGLEAALGMLGYRVTAVRSGEDALAVAGSAEFDLLLTDLRLPGIPGGDVARALQGRMPALRVILMSGYAEDVAVRAELASGRVRFLQKPFSMEAVAREIAAALEG